MKRIIALTLAVLLMTAMAGCTRSLESTTASTQKPTEATLPTFTRPTGGLQNPNTIALGEQGKIRCRYSVNISTVRYITSVDQVPQVDGMERFDEAYFQEKALLVVLETVTSGSVGVKIDKVTVEDGKAVVTLGHIPGAEIGTTDMTVWMLWAEVEKGLEYQWQVANPALEPGTSDY